MDGIADMGGTEGWGPTHPPLVDEPVFGEAWEGRAFALALLSTRLAGWNLDAFRHALERLSRAAYLDDGYFGRWLNAAELVLTDSAFMAPEAVEARARTLRGKHVVEPPPSQPVRPDYKPTAEGSLRAVVAAPAFAVGERVRVKNMSRTGHSRLPRYVRGHTGVSNSSSRRPCCRTRTRTSRVRIHSTFTRFSSTRTSCGVPRPNRSH